MGIKTKRVASHEFRVSGFSTRNPQPVTRNSAKFVKTRRKSLLRKGLFVKMGLSLRGGCAASDAAISPGMGLLRHFVPRNDAEACKSVKTRRNSLVRKGCIVKMPVETSGEKVTCRKTAPAGTHVKGFLHSGRCQPGYCGRNIMVGIRLRHANRRGTGFALSCLRYGRGVSCT